MRAYVKFVLFLVLLGYMVVRIKYYIQINADYGRLDKGNGHKKLTKWEQRKDKIEFKK